LKTVILAKGKNALNDFPTQTDPRFVSFAKVKRQNQSMNAQTIQTKQSQVCVVVIKQNKQATTIMIES